MLDWIKRALALNNPHANRVYGLDHAVLNMHLPPQTMWMNMGYWEVSLLLFFHIIPLAADAADDNTHADMYSIQRISRRRARRSWMKS